MSFWNLNDGTQAQATNEFDTGGGDLEPIPNNTGCIAAIEEAKWDWYESDRFIVLRWKVLKPEQYKNRVIFHKLKVFGTSNDKDPQAAADKAKRMLAAIDTNAGGKLMQLQAEPSDQDLMSALVGKMMAIKVMVWEIDKDRNGNTIPPSDRKRGNWISAVSPAGGSAAAKAPAAPAQQAPVQQAPAAQAPEQSVDFEDDIPF